MHVVFGGLYNGKTQYVIEHYEPTVILEVLPTKSYEAEVIAIKDFPKLIEPFLHMDEVVAAEEIIRQIEQLAQTNTVICICDDISRGIVPMDKQQRQLRDTLGRLYQRLFLSATSVTQIWYGLAQTLK